MENDTTKTVEVHHEKPIKTSSAVWLSSANCMSSILCMAEGGVLNYFYLTYLHLDAVWVSLAWILFGIWNAINDPIYGFISDHTKTKIGRRKPYIRYGGPILALLFILMWVVVPWEGNQVAMFVQMMVTLFLFDTVWTAVASAIYVMPYEMKVTNRARQPYFIWNIVFSIFSFGIPMLLSTQLENILSGSGYNAFFWIMVGIGLIAGAVIFVSTFFYKENQYVKDEKQPSIWKAIVNCIKNPAFLLFEVISITVIFAQNSMITGLSYYFGCFGDVLGSYGLYLTIGSTVLGCIAAVFFYVFMVNKIGARNCTLIMCILMAIGCLLLTFLGNSIWFAIPGFFCVGIGLAGGLYLIPMINGDVIDYDEIKNGGRREGMYAGVNSLITKPFQSLGIASFNYIFVAFGYDSNIELIKQSASAKSGMLIAWTLIPALLLILSFVAMIFFPLRGKKWDDEKAQLAKRHEEKEAIYEQEILKKEEQK